MRIRIHQFRLDVMPKFNTSKKSTIRKNKKRVLCLQAPACKILP
jgi:hypothetical protein